MNKKQKGFSLIELLIVVAIILIIAAIAIPNLLRARMAANESSAVGTVRTIVTAEVTYSSTWNTGFATTLQILGGTTPCVAIATNACLIDNLIAQGGPKSGYLVAAVGANTVNGITNSFGASAYPVTQGTTGTRTFCSDESGVVRVDINGAPMAGPTDAGCQLFPSLQ
jgi:type IV pilus assembly protein PilA